MLTQVAFRNPYLWIPPAVVNCFMSTLVVSGSFKPIRIRIENTGGFQEN
jgi:hypothetical protein